jgi:serine/threonine protein kinase
MSMTWDTKALEIDRADDHQYFFLLVTFKLSVNVHTCASIMATSWITHPRLSILSNPFLSSNVIFTSLDLTPPPPDRHSSAKDQLGGTAVAIKKIMKPFSTPVLSKRTYRELKLLKHLRHENVSLLDGLMRRRCG